MDILKFIGGMFVLLLVVRFLMGDSFAPKFIRRPRHRDDDPADVGNC